MQTDEDWFDRLAYVEGTGAQGESQTGHWWLAHHQQGADARETEAGREPSVRRPTPKAKQCNEVVCRIDQRIKAAAVGGSAEFREAYVLDVGTHAARAVVGRNASGGDGERRLHVALALDARRIALGRIVLGAVILPLRALVSYDRADRAGALHRAGAATGADRCCSGSPRVFGFVWALTRRAAGVRRADGAVAGAVGSAAFRGAAASRRVSPASSATAMCCWRIRCSDERSSIACSAI